MNVSDKSTEQTAVNYIYLFVSLFMRLMAFQKAGLQDGGRFSSCVDLGLLYLPVDAGWF